MAQNKSKPSEKTTIAVFRKDYKRFEKMAQRGKRPLIQQFTVLMDHVATLPLPANPAEEMAQAETGATK